MNVKILICGYGSVFYKKFSFLIYSDELDAVEVYDPKLLLDAFEFSARIVAGTNIYMDGSPYYGLLYGESISMGRRIAREIKDAKSQNRLDEIIT